MPRKFLTRGVSQTGRVFQVFQCISCGEFVSISKDRYTGDDYILFRGRNFTPRHNQHPNYRWTVGWTPTQRNQARPMQLKPVTCLIPFAIGLALIVAGCSKREFKTTLTAEEAIPLGAPVLLDGRPVGNVSSLRQEGPTRLATLRITDRPAFALMRTGLEREPGTVGEIKLSSLRATGAPLEPGSLIPTRSLIKDATTKTITNLQLFLWTVRDKLVDHPAIAIGVVAALLLAAVWLIRRLAVRGACLIVIFCLVLYFASLKAQGQELGFSRQSLISEQQETEHHLQRARDEIRAAKELVHGLAGMADSHLVIASIILDRAQQPGNEERIRAMRPGGLAYNRQREIARLLALAAEQDSRRSRLVDEINVLYGAQGPAVTNTWPGLTLYQARHHELALNLQTKPSALTNLLRALETGYPPAPILNAALGVESVAGKPTVLTPPLVITNQIIEYVTNTQTVTNLERVIIERPATNALAFSAELEQLRQQGSNMQQDLAAIRNALPPAPSQPAETTTSDIQSIQFPPSTNAIKLNQTAASTTAPPPSISEARPMLPHDTAPDDPSGYAAWPQATKSEPATTQVPTSGTPAKESTALHPQTGGSTQRPASPYSTTAAKAVSIGTGLLLAIGAFLFTLANHARRRPMHVHLYDPAGHQHQILLPGPDDVAVLSAPPSSAPSGCAGAEAAIGRDAVGRPILFPAGGTTVNGAAATCKRRLRPGDEVSLVGPAGPATWIFGGMTTLEAHSLEAEPETTS